RARAPACVGRDGAVRPVRRLRGADRDAGADRRDRGARRRPHARRPVRDLGRAARPRRVRALPGRRHGARRRPRVGRRSAGDPAPPARPDRAPARASPRRTPPGLRVSPGPLSPTGEGLALRLRALSKLGLVIYSERARAALRFAERAHRGQQRKGGDEPYILHPITVATLLAASGGDEDLICAAYLHDVVEDAGVELDEIAAMFGDEVAAMGAAVTGDQLRATL